MVDIGSLAVIGVGGAIMLYGISRSPLSWFSMVVGALVAVVGFWLVA